MFRVTVNMAAGWIVLTVVWCLHTGVEGDITVTTTENLVGLLGDNEVELVCTYSLASVDTVFTIAWSRETSKDSGTYEQLAGFSPPGGTQNPAVLTNLTNPSVFGRVVLTNPTDASLTAKMKFTSVVCGDERKYQCTVLGLNNGAQVNPIPSSDTSLTVTESTTTPTPTTATMTVPSEDLTPRGCTTKQTVDGQGSPLSYYGINSPVYSWNVLLSVPVVLLLATVVVGIFVSQMTM